MSVQTFLEINLFLVQSSKTLLPSVLNTVFFFFCSGAGSDGVEEIKRHPFFSTVDWNVSTKGSE